MKEPECSEECVCLERGRWMRHEIERLRKRVALLENELTREIIRRNEDEKKNENGSESN